MILKLDSIYKNPSTALQIVVRSKLENLKLKDFKELDYSLGQVEKKHVTNLKVLVLH